MLNYFVKQRQLMNWICLLIKLSATKLITETSIYIQELTVIILLKNKTMTHFHGFFEQVSYLVDAEMSCLLLHVIPPCYAT